jgi:hypothetical protein
MKPKIEWVLLLLGCWVGSAQAQEQQASVQVSGQVRWQWEGVQANTAGPLAAANALQNGTTMLPASSATLQTELHATGHGITEVVTLQQQHLQGRATDSHAWVNELYASHDGGAWQFSAGKKIVAWDVGYGFRPNDMVQQEERRALVSSTDEGRPMLVAEHFDASTSWTVVWVNPNASVNAPGAQEPALAARIYQRQGAADWYGFARLGARTGASAGAALAWVASEELELHSSVRYAQGVDSQTMAAGVNGLVLNNPWQASSQGDVAQLLLGGTWTNQSQVSLLAEAWWDGSAPSDAQWKAWSQRNHQLGGLAGFGAPAAAVAGNLAWQADAFNASSNLRRSNVFVRLSWQNGAWQPALDVLYTPADQGRTVTGSLSWQGDRWQVQAGWRMYGGPLDAVIAQLPLRRQGFVAAAWAF